MKRLIFLLSALLSPIWAETIPSDFIQPTHWEVITGEGMTGYHAILILETNAEEKTLLYQLGPNAEIQKTAIHNTSEQVVIVDGELIWLNDNQTTQCLLQKGAYVNRPPGIPHGPFKAGPYGCLMFVRYYNP